MYFIQFKGHERACELPPKFCVNAENKGSLEKEISKKVGQDTSILILDSLDVDNHPGNAILSIGGYTYNIELEDVDVINK